MGDPERSSAMMDDPECYQISGVGLVILATPEKYLILRVDKRLFWQRDSLVLPIQLSWRYSDGYHLGTPVFFHAIGLGRRIVKCLRLKLGKKSQFR